LSTLKKFTLIFKFRAAMTFFIIGLVISGVTAFPLLFELRILSKLVSEGDLGLWISTIREGLETTYARYPWIGYGTDWLAFGHLVIAMFFVHPLIHPRSSRPNIVTGIVACVAIFPLAMICGPLRGIPFYWRLIDCSFGVIGVIPLVYCLCLLRKMEIEPS
jgi:succinate-acetate transporter protein